MLFQKKKKNRHHGMKIYRMYSGLLITVNTCTVRGMTGCRFVGGTFVSSRPHRVKDITTEIDSTKHLPWLQMTASPRNNEAVRPLTSFNAANETDCGGQKRRNLLPLATKMCCLEKRHGRGNHLTQQPPQHNRPEKQGKRENIHHRSLKYTKFFSQKCTATFKATSRMGNLSW